MISLPQPRTILQLAIAAILLAVLSHARADPDLWGHVLFGRDIVAARAIPSIDSYSFTSDRPWVNHEWLAECVMYMFYAAGGTAGLVALKVLLLSGALVAVLTTMPRTVDAMSRDFLLGLVVVGITAQASHVRPQLFSIGLFACLLAALVSSSRRSGRHLVWVPLIMALWVNLHGGWIVGAGVLVMWSAVSLADSAHRHESRLLVAAAVTGCLATLVNPYGWRLWQFLGETVRLKRTDIIDWQPIFQMGGAYLLVWVLISAAGVLGWYASRERHLPSAAVILMLIGTSFRVNRLLAFLSIAVVMLMGRDITQLLFGPNRREKAVVRPSRFAIMVSLAIGLPVFAGGVAMTVRHLRCIPMDASLYPDQAAAFIVARDKLRGRMLTWFDWGEYVIWHFRGQVQVSIDGRRETVYSESLVQDHLRFYFDPESRHNLLNRWRPDYIWLPSYLPVIPELRKDGWTVLYAGANSTLLEHFAPDSPITSDRSKADVVRPRCFPAP